MKKYIGQADTTYKDIATTGEISNIRNTALDRISQICVGIKGENIAQLIKWEILNKVCGNPKQSMYFIFN